MEGMVVNVDEMMNTVLVCDICTEPFNSSDHVPLLLPCRHSFCTPCLETYGKGGSFNCPTCRHPITLKGFAAASLPRDIISLKIVDFLAMKAAPKEIPCQECPDHNTADFRCLTCGLSMCEECRRAHVRVPLSRNHQIRSISELVASPSDFLQEAETCNHHPGAALNLYCSSPSCLKALCTTCAMVSHRQDSHLVQELPVVYQRARDELGKLGASLQEEKEKCKKTSDELNKKWEMVDTASAAAVNNINASVDAIKVALENRRLELLKQVNQIKERHQKALFQDHKSVQDRSNEAQETLKFLEKAECLSRPAELLGLLHEQIPGIKQFLASQPPSSFQAARAARLGKPKAGMGFSFPQTQYAGLGPNEDYNDKTSVQFTPRGEQLLKAINNFGVVSDLWPLQR